MPLLLGLLMLSGGCALIYQVLWLRLLALTFGVTVHAAATVLGCFMGGLAVGSVLAGRWADRHARPLFLFGLVELSIGVCGIVSPFAIAAVQTVFASVAPQLPDSVVAGTAVRVVLSFAVLLVPTALMGATMPVVVKSSLAKIEGLGTRVSLLYAANTAGAIAGTVLAGFYLIPSIGLSRAFLLAAAINATVGVLAMFASRWVPGPIGADDAADPVPSSNATARGSDIRSTEWDARAALVVAGISGFASLALEVVWFRLLAIFQGPFSYTFTVVLAMVLTGIAIGSAIAAPVLRLRRLDWVQILVFLQLLGVVLVLQSISGILQQTEAPMWLERLLIDRGVGFAVPTVAMCLGAVLPASVFFGVSFPIALRIWAGGVGGSDIGRRVGAFYAVNVGGAILGSLTAGFVLLPLLGSRGSVILLASLYVLAGIGLQFVCARRQPMMTGLAAVGLVAVALQFPTVPDPLDLIHRRVYYRQPLLWQDEGMQTTVAVVGSDYDRTLFLDGKHQANDSRSMVLTHRQIGLLPVVLHPRPRRALVVGLGGGASPGAMAQYPGLRVDVVELSKGVVNAAWYFSHVNFDILRHPSVHIRLDDGRNFLQQVRSPYDVITADAIIPRHAGANSLYSVEYFRIVRAALAPGGLVLHWNGGANAAEYNLILAAFFTAFPNTTLWADGALMVGSHDPLVVSRRRIDELLADPGTREVLKLMGVQRPEQLERMLRAGPDDVRAYLGATPPLSDDRPVLEYFQSLKAADRDPSAMRNNPVGVFRD